MDVYAETGSMAVWGHVCMLSFSIDVNVSTPLKESSNRHCVLAMVVSSYTRKIWKMCSQLST